MLHYLTEMEFGPKEIMRIMEVTDGLCLHREAVRIPLWNQGEGLVQLVSGGTVVEITAPGEGEGKGVNATLPYQETAGEGKQHAC